MKRQVELLNITHSFQGVPILENYSQTLLGDACYLLTGRSGIGKTTLLNIVSGLLVPDEGAVNLFGGRVSYVFQDNRLFPWLSVLDNAALAGSREKATALLTALGLGADVNKMPHELSGGMQRRVAIARALCAGGDIFLFDEPFSGLDADTRAQTAALIREHIVGHTAIIVSHTVDEVALFDAQTLTL